jgi:hypothetical protein
VLKEGLAGVAACRGGRYHRFGSARPSIRAIAKNPDRRTTIITPSIVRHVQAACRQFPLKGDKGILISPATPRRMFSPSASKLLIDILSTVIIAMLQSVT